VTYTWTQVSGPMVDVSDAETASPTVGGFVQTDAIQECEFELLVSDGELTSRPDRVSVVVVPSFGASTMRLENASFDPNKPTFIYFAGYRPVPWVTPANTSPTQIGLTPAIS